MTRKKSANNDAATKITAISSAVRTGGSTDFEDDAAAKTGIMVDAASTPKPLGIQSEAGGSKTKTGEEIRPGTVDDSNMEVESATGISTPQAGAVRE